MAMQDIGGQHPHHTNQPMFDSGLNILFLSAFPLVLWLFEGSAVLIATAIAEMFLLSCALRLISRGQVLEQAYDAAPVAQAPRLPRKLLGAGLIGLMVMILAGHHFYTLFMPILLGIAASGLSIAAFGLDPMRDKGMDNPEVLERQRVTAKVEQLQLDLASAVHGIAGLGDADLTRRTETAQKLIDDLVDVVVDDPAKLKRAQKPIAKFVDILTTEANRLEASWEGEDYLFARRRYVAKLEVLVESFGAHARKSGVSGPDDEFDRAAANLLDRMPHESAA